ncbi:hypothetical protein [Bradyrhizobium ottawaense]|uniref:hypothetical protein n=1 Tax=Bradyrhizobium ottawaense TaxID=931866 RepID=UPI0030F46277
MMKRCARVCLAVLAMGVSNPVFGAQKSIQWVDGAFCEFETRFDPAKDNEESLRNTINVIFGDDKFYSYISSFTPPDAPGGVRRMTTDELERTCKLAKDRAASLPVIALPGIELFRRLKIEELEDGCWFYTVLNRAKAGETAALREYAPSAAACSAYIDALEGKADLRAFWREMTDTKCRAFADPERCRIDAQKGHSDADADEQRKSDVLGFGWNNCSTGYLKKNVWAKKSELMRKALEANFRRRFKVKAFPCAD